MSGTLTSKMLSKTTFTAVCEGKVDLATAQRDMSKLFRNVLMAQRGIAKNWVSAYKKYFQTEGPLPEHASFLKDQISRWLQLFAQVNNLFDRRFYTAAQLGPTGFTVTGNFIGGPFPAVNGEFPVQQATFFAPGAPRGAWGGVRFTF